MKYIVDLEAFRQMNLRDLAHFVESAANDLSSHQDEYVELLVKLGRALQAAEPASEEAQRDEGTGGNKNNDALRNERNDALGNEVVTSDHNGATENVVLDLLFEQGSYLRSALHGREPCNLGAVLLAPDLPPLRAAVAFARIPRLRVVESGCAIDVCPIEFVQELAARFDEKVARRLERSPGVDWLWTLVVLPHAVAVTGLACWEGAE